MKKILISLFLILVFLDVKAQLFNPEYIKLNLSFKEFVDFAKSVDYWHPQDAPYPSLADDSVILDYRISDYKVVNNVYTGTDYIYLFQNDRLFRVQVEPHSFEDFSNKLLVNHEFLTEEDVDLSQEKFREGYREHITDKKYTYYNNTFGYNTVVVVRSFDTGYEVQKSYRIYCEPVN